MASSSDAESRKSPSCFLPRRELRGNHAQCPSGAGYAGADGVIGAVGLNLIDDDSRYVDGFLEMGVDVTTVS